MIDAIPSPYGLCRYTFQDWTVNKGNPKARLILVFFRLASYLRRRPGWNRNPFTLVIGIAYRLLVEWLLGVEIPWRTVVGPRLQIFHGFGLVINDSSVLGSDIVLRHNVTIGHLIDGGACPVIQDGVQFGAGSAVLGDVTVGEGVKVGALSLVLSSVPAGASVGGVPARLLSSSAESTASISEVED